MVIRDSCIKNEVKRFLMASATEITKQTPHLYLFTHGLFHTLKLIFVEGSNY